MPNLKSLNISKNQLQTLPLSLLNVSVNTYRIAGNPFKNLPSEFKNVDSDLSLDEKKRLFDWMFQSKNPNAIDENLFNLHFYPKEKQQLAEQIDAVAELAQYKDFILNYATMATYLVYDETAEIALGTSKVGGAPDLPKGVAHPQNDNGELYTFHTQLNCAEIAPFQRYLPRKGMLYFFINDEEYAENPLLIYSEETSDLVRHQYNENDEWIDSDVSLSYLREAKKVHFENQISLPELYNSENHAKARYPKYKALWDATLDDEAHWQNIDKLEDALMDLNDSIKKPGWSNGHSTYSTHSINSYVFTQHESPQEQASAKFGGEPSDWLVLLCMESVDEFNFWDAGTLAYCIHKKDLAIADFSRIYTSIESS